MEALDLDTYQRLVGEIPFGKALPSAVYIHVDGVTNLPPALLAMVARLPSHLGIAVDDFNIIKFAKRELALSLLSYPDFEHEAHPALSRSLHVDLSSGESQERDYRRAANPPILHRKELFLPSGDKRIPAWSALSQAEEAAGLYENTSTIGMLDGWMQTCRDRGVTIAGHQITVDVVDPERRSPQELVANKAQLKASRWKTALSRFGLSTPVQAILRLGLLDEDKTLLDYGCGLGDDCLALRKIGHQVQAWDPHFRPDDDPRTAAVVNLGFVINVIEDQAERADTLRHAYSLAQEVMVVGVMLRRERYTDGCQPWGDGVISNIGTFQTYFDQNELVTYIEHVLGHEPITVGPGIAIVFADSSRRHAFLARRTQRHIDFQQLSGRLFADKPRTSTYSAYDQQLRLYDQNRELIEDFWAHLSSLGRIPKANEYPRFPELHAIGLSPQQARNLYHGMFGREALSAAFWQEHSELVEACWEAMAQHGRRLRPGEFAREGELAAIGLSTSKLFNHLVRKRGLEALQQAFVDRHLALLQSCWDTMTALGRIPKPSELPQLADLQSIGLGIASMHQLFIDRFGQETLDEAYAIRRDDLLIYWALANFQDRVPRKELPRNIQRDLDTFFGGYSKALKEAQSLLFAAGDSGLIARICDNTSFGELDDQALYIHNSLIDQLHPVLRVYIGCGNVLHGDVASADIIKIHKRSGKLTLLYYDNFERNRLPVLTTRVKIWLRGQRMDEFDHGSGDQTQVLYNKHRYVGKDHPRRQAWQQFSRKLESVVGQIRGRGPSKEQVAEALEESGYDLQLRRIRPASQVHPHTLSEPGSERFGKT